MRSIIGTGLRLTKVFHHSAICDSFLTERGYKIVVDDSGHPALPVEIEDN
jgi:hypothetical protein